MMKCIGCPCVSNERKFLSMKCQRIFAIGVLWKCAGWLYYPLLDKHNVGVYQMWYVRFTKMPRKHNQLKGIKKYPQNDPKVLYSSNLALACRLLLSRQSFRSKTLWNRRGKKFELKSKYTSPFSQWVCRLNPVKWLGKAKKSKIWKVSRNYCIDFEQVSYQSSSHCLS